MNQQNQNVDFTNSYHQQLSAATCIQYNVPSVSNQGHQLGYSMANTVSSSQQHFTPSQNLNLQKFSIPSVAPVSSTPQIPNVNDSNLQNFLIKTLSEKEISYSSFINSINQLTPHQQNTSLQQNNAQLGNANIRTNFHTAKIMPKLEDIAFNSKIRAPISKTSNYWCNIFYYEMDQRVGDVYKTTQRQVIVDGLCATSDNTRFCLGMLANVNRNPVSARARRQIGKGCRIYEDETGITKDIIVINLSESPIFLQSPLYAASIGDDLSTVYRLPQDSKMKVFDNKTFEEMIRISKIEGYFSIHSIQPMCNIRISFVKGWGAEYNRPTITTTPCWVEVQFLHSLQVLSNILDSLEIPNPEANNE